MSLLRARMPRRRNISISRSVGCDAAILPWVRGQIVTWNIGGLHPMLPVHCTIDDLLRRATELAIQA